MAKDPYNPDYIEKVARQIRLIALGMKNKDTLSCEFGNQFTPIVEDLLREKFAMGIEDKQCTFCEGWFSTIELNEGLLGDLICDDCANESGED